MEIISDDGGLLGLVPDSWPPGCVKIAAVLPDSQAEQHKLCVGDELRSINGHEVEELDHRRMALELAKRPLKLMIHRPKEPPSLVIDVEVDVNAGAMGFFPKQWPPGPVVVGAVLPKKIADTHGVREGDLLWLVAEQQASLMSPAELTKALSQRPVSLRFVRGDSATIVARDLGNKTSVLAKGTPGTSERKAGDSEIPTQRGILHQQRDLQVQQLHLQQLQHRKEQAEIPKPSEGSDRAEWLSLLERQKDERYAMQSMQREHLSQLEESLKQHQDLLEELDQDRGTGYNDVPIPALIPKPKAKVVKVTESQEEIGSAEVLQSQKPMEPIEPTIEDESESTIEHVELEEKNEPEQSVNEEQPEKASSLLCESKPVYTPEISPPEFLDLPLSALEPQSKMFDMPKSTQKQLRAAKSSSPWSTGAELCLVEDGQSPTRVLREVPPPVRPPSVTWCFIGFLCFFCGWSNCERVDKLMDRIDSEPADIHVPNDMNGARLRQSHVFSMFCHVHQPFELIERLGRK